MSLYLGIDFGTSTNYVTRWDDREKRVEPVNNITDYNSSKTVFPNVIFYESATNYIVGDRAFKAAIVNPENGVYAIKRHIEEDGFSRYIPALNKELNSEEIASDIFHWIKDKIEGNYGGTSIDGVVISVPFSFQHRERERIKKAAENAGLNVLGLIEEPVAAALSFGLVDQVQNGNKEKILIFDLGGGTFDVTIFDFKKVSNKKFDIEVLTTDGAKRLGGMDIDDLVVKKLLEDIGTQYSNFQLGSLDPGIQNKILSELRMTAITAKENLSDYDEESVLFTSDYINGVEYDKDIEVEQFNAWVNHSGFISQIQDVLDNSLLELDIAPDAIDRIILVGGTSNIPIIHDLVTQYFGKEPEKIKAPDMMVGEGAGIYCGICLDKSMEYTITTRVSHAIGIKNRGKFDVYIPRNTKYGTPSKIKYFSISHKEKEKRLEIYQGNSGGSLDRCTKVANIALTTAIQSKLTGKHIGVQLNTDLNGMITYCLYDVLDNGSNKVLMEGIAEEELK